MGTFLKLILVLSAQLALLSAHTQASAPRVAVCVAGAVRSLIEQVVYESMWSFFHLEDVDVYFHLFTATELSARGQRNLTTAHETQLHEALKYAKGVRFQATENPTTCGQMTTGKFYKIEMCAKMIQTAITEGELKYDILVVTRPDLEYDVSRYHNIHSFTLQRNDNWFVQVGDEMYVAAFQQGIALSATLTKARCCDVKRHLPPQCFLAPSARDTRPPRANFIQRRHFQIMNQISLFRGRPPYRIVRTMEQQLEINGRDTFTLHGLTKPDVGTFADPVLSPPILNWYNLTDGEQLNWLEAYLSKPNV